MTPTHTAPLLQVTDLHVRFSGADGEVHATDGVTFDVNAGEIVAVVGESGSGKSVTALSLLGLLPDTATVGGSVALEGQELLHAPAARLREIRGRKVAMIFQDPLSALNPVQRIGGQIAEQIRAHESVPRAAARARAVELLRQVGIPEPEVRARAYPHELSGGMRQRVMIAMALACEPSLLIADEPTTALDVTVQAQILDLLRDLVERRGLAVILVTHDLGVVAEMADRVAVMYAGQIVETAPVQDIFADPRHPYTWGLLGSLPHLGGERPTRLRAIAGSPPSLIDPAAGCRFAPRCPHRRDDCASPVDLREAAEAGSGHRDRCVLPAAAQRALRVDAAGEIGLQAGVSP